MTNFKAMLPKTVWIGTLGVAAMLIGWTPSCKAQEVSPAIFTNTGVEDVYPVAKPVAKKTAKVQVVSHASQGVAINLRAKSSRSVFRPLARIPRSSCAPRDAHSAFERPCRCWPHLAWRARRTWYPRQRSEDRTRGLGAKVDGQSSRRAAAGRKSASVGANARTRHRVS